MKSRVNLVNALHLVLFRGRLLQIGLILMRNYYKLIDVLPTNWILLLKHYEQILVFLFPSKLCSLLTVHFYGSTVTVSSFFLKEKV